MGSFRWIAFVAARYISKGRQNRSNPTMILAVLGILIGVLALTVILSVMNGFQLGFIESILEISSFHIRLESLPGNERARGLEERIAALPGVNSALPFMDLTGIVRGSQGRQQTAAVRGLPADALEKDRGMGTKLKFDEGAFDLEEPDSILLGTELARRLNAGLGDQISLLSISGIFPAEASPEDSAFTVRGIFDSGFYEYDLGWAFIKLETAEKLEGKERASLGIKIKNRWQDARVLARVREIAGPEYLLRSWRDYNRAFFGALRTEKLLMFVLVGLIFIVVGLNIFQAQRKAVLERREEIGLLRAVGAADREVRLIFVWDGLIIGGTGAGLGTALGLLLSYHIGPFFAALEALANGLFSFLNFILGGFPAAGGIGGDFAIFSPAIFYIKEIPSRVIPQEVFLIFMFGFLSAVLAAWFASGKVSRTGPAEVLRYE